MEMMDIIKTRHSVRSYHDKPLEQNQIEQLQAEIMSCHQESGLNIQLVLNEKEAFQGLMAHYGKLRNVNNYIAMVGKKSQDLDEKIGYYGERLVLKAQQLGLNTCWVALTYRKGKCQSLCDHDEKCVCVIALGYGVTQGVPHKSKPIHKFCHSEGKPDWFIKGVEAAMYAPTALNQQKFFFDYDGEYVSAYATGGVYSKIDLGIVKYHFESVVPKEMLKWK